MREEYDLKKLKVKRHGLLPELQDEKGKSVKVRITISLDQDIVDYFKQSADRVGSLPYQTQINQVLRKAIEKSQQGDIETVKLELLKDADFIRTLTTQISIARHHQEITMGNKFNLSGLTYVYQEAIREDRPTLVFEVKNGKGRFLFMMFFDDEDESKDIIYIFMRNTMRFLERKLYGNHLKGEFYIYLEDYMKKFFKDELLIQSPATNNPFIFEDFFDRLNESIPNSIPLNRIISVFRDCWNEVKDELPKEIVDDYDKTILIGPKRLPEHKEPREKTLRKLYLHANGNEDEITRFIALLIQRNMTVAWTNDINKANRSVKSILNKML